jgi:hypothetical protein
VISPTLSEEHAHLEWKALSVGWTDKADKPKQKILFIRKCNDTYRDLGRRKHHIVPNVSISFVNLFELVPW